MRSLKTTLLLAVFISSVSLPAFAQKFQPGGRLGEGLAEKIEKKEGESRIPPKNIGGVLVLSEKLTQKIWGGSDDAKIDRLKTLLGESPDPGLPTPGRHDDGWYNTNMDAAGYCGRDCYPVCLQEKLDTCFRTCPSYPPTLYTYTTDDCFLNCFDTAEHECQGEGRTGICTTVFDLDPSTGCSEPTCPRDDFDDCWDRAIAMVGYMAACDRICANSYCPGGVCSSISSYNQYIDCFSSCVATRAEELEDEEFEFPYFCSLNAYNNCVSGGSGSGGSSGNSSASSGGGGDEDECDSDCRWMREADRAWRRDAAKIDDLIDYCRDMWDRIESIEQEYLRSWSPLDQLAYEIERARDTVSLKMNGALRAKENADNRAAQARAAGEENGEVLTEQVLEREIVDSFGHALAMANSELESAELTVDQVRDYLIPSLTEAADAGIVDEDGSSWVDWGADRVGLLCKNLYNGDWGRNMYDGPGDWDDEISGSDEAIDDTYEDMRRIDEFQDELEDRLARLNNIIERMDGAWTGESEVLDAKRANSPVRSITRITKELVGDVNEDAYREATRMSQESQDAYLAAYDLYEGFLDNLTGEDPSLESTLALLEDYRISIEALRDEARASLFSADGLAARGTLPPTEVQQLLQPVTNPGGDSWPCNTLNLMSLPFEGEGPDSDPVSFQFSPEILNCFSSLNPFSIPTALAASSDRLPAGSHQTSGGDPGGEIIEAYSNYLVERARKAYGRILRVEALLDPFETPKQSSLKWGIHRAKYVLGGVMKALKGLGPYTIAVLVTPDPSHTGFYLQGDEITLVLSTQDAQDFSVRIEGPTGRINYSTTSLSNELLDRILLVLTHQFAHLHWQKRFEEFLAQSGDAFQLNDMHAAVLAEAEAGMVEAVVAQALGAPVSGILPTKASRAIQVGLTRYGYFRALTMDPNITFSSTIAYGLSQLSDGELDDIEKIGLAAEWDNMPFIDVPEISYVLDKNSPEAVMIYRITGKEVTPAEWTEFVVHLGLTGIPADDIAEDHQIAFSELVDYFDWNPRDEKLTSADFSAWDVSLVRIFQLIEKYYEDEDSAYSETAYSLLEDYASVLHCCALVTCNPIDALRCSEVPDVLWAWKSLVLDIVGQNGFALPFVHPPLRGDRDVAKKAVEGSYLAFQDVSEGLRNDRDFVLWAVSEHGAQLQYANPRRQDDLEIVTAAIGWDPAQFIFASDRIQGDRPSLLRCINAVPFGEVFPFEYIDETVLQDPAFMQAACYLNGSTYLKAVALGLPIVANPDFALACARHSISAFEVMETSLAQTTFQTLLAELGTEGLSLPPEVTSYATLKNVLAEYDNLKDPRKFRTLQSLAKLHSNRLKVNSRTSEEEQHTVLILYPKSDWNLSFKDDATIHYFFNDPRFFTLYYEIGTEEDLKWAIHDVTNNFTVPVHTLWIGGHGSPGSLDLGTELTETLHQEWKYLDLEDFDDETGVAGVAWPPALSSVLNKSVGHQVVLDSCSTAAGSGEEMEDGDDDGISDTVELNINLIERIKDSVKPGMRVLGYKVSSRIRTIWVDENLDIYFELKDGGAENVYIGIGGED